MLRVTIELVPHGVESMKRTIATARIVNDGTGDHSIGNYTYTVKGAERILAEGRVTGFPRLAKDAWALLGLIIKDARRFDDNASN
jgi:hypothetical protein